MFFLFLRNLRRVGRVVECGSLENYCAAMYRGFESLTLRHFNQTSLIGVFLFQVFYANYKIKKSSFKYS